MEKKWFIEIQGIIQGPFSVLDLKRNPHVTPDTLVWKEGFPKWIPMRYVPELKEVFKDDEEPQPEEETTKKFKFTEAAGKDELAIDMRRNLPPVIFWLIVALIIVCYLIYRVNLPQ